MKQTLCVLCTLAFLIVSLGGLFIAASVCADEIKPGDINGDGTVNSIDAFVLYKKVSAGNLTDTERTTADLDFDGTVSMTDAFILYMVSAGKATMPTTTTTTTKASTTVVSPGGRVVTNEQLRQIEAGFLRLINEERASVGVTPLTINTHLDSVAQLRSEEIIEYFSHTRPDGTLFHTAIDIDEYLHSTVGENICYTTHFGAGFYDETFYWTGSSEQIKQAYTTIYTLFRESEGHHENYLKAKYLDAGIGISYRWVDDGVPMFYVAHVFGKQVQ